MIKRNEQNTDLSTQLSTQTRTINSIQLTAANLEEWLDRELNLLVGRWIEFASPDSIANFDTVAGRRKPI